MTFTRSLFLVLIALIAILFFNVNIMASNISLFNQEFHHLKLESSKSLFNGSHNSSIIPQSRGERGIYSEPYFEHEYHEPIHAPQYIVKLIAPRKHSRDTGIAELLLILAPLTAIPLIGSAALTTFTALFATGGYGKRRKRDLVTRELLTRSFSDLRPVNQYTHQSLTSDRDRSFSNFNTPINVNENGHTFPINDMSWRKSDSFGSQTTPKSQLIRVRIEDENNWKVSDLDENARTGVNKRPLMHNTSESSTNTEHQSVSTLVKVLEKPYKETISSSYRQSKGILSKRDQEEPIQKEEYKISLGKSPYRRKTDTGPDLIVMNNNENVKESKNKEKKKSDNVPKIYSDPKDMSGSLSFEDLSSQESATITKTAEVNGDDSPSLKLDNKEKSDRFDFNTWIPFLSNPYLTDIAKGEGKREIQELDIIQKYLNTMGRPDYNDEIIATYLSCNGMLSASNQCLERLTCQFSDTSSGLKQLEKDVSSLVIYSLLKNEHIDNGFKSRLQRAAFFGRDNTGKCNFYNCPKINDQKPKNPKRRR